MTRRDWITALVAGAALSALFWIDALFIPLALLAPLALGVYAGRRSLPWAWPATAALVAGLGAVVSDWLVNREDVVFHLVLTALLLALATGAWFAAGARRGATA